MKKNIGRIISTFCDFFSRRQWNERVSRVRDCSGKPAATLSNFFCAQMRGLGTESPTLCCLLVFITISGGDCFVVPPRNDDQLRQAAMGNPQIIFMLSVLILFEFRFLYLIVV